MLHNSIKIQRVARELTQSDLATMVGVTRQTIAFIERGEFAPSVTLALKLAQSLQTPITKLFWITTEE